MQAVSKQMVNHRVKQKKTEVSLPYGLQGFTNSFLHVRKLGKKDEELRLKRVRSLQIRKDSINILSDDEKRKIVDLMHSEKITKEDYLKLEDGQRLEFRLLCTKAMNCLADQDLDRFIEHVVSSIANDNTKSNIWESNHSRIMWALDKLTREDNKFPSRGELSQATELSRVTINKHLKEYLGSDLHKWRKEELRLQRDNVLARVYKFATLGDIKACKVFLDATNVLSEPRITNQQNNYIQINGFVITEEDFKTLPPKTIKSIENILKSKSKNNG